MYRFSLSIITNRLEKRGEKEMKKMLSLFLVLALSVGAESYTVFVHGKSSSNHNGVGVTDVNGYWGGTDSTVTGKKIFIGYDGTSDPRTYGTARAQTNLSTGLSTYCKTGNTCRIVCHSAGCYATGYWLATALGGSTASSKGFNITKVTALASAAGGSELASALNGISFGWLGNAMDKSLIVETARSSFNQNNTAGVPIFHIAGTKGMAGASLILPGQDDFAVSLHSANGYSRVGGIDKCQSSYTQYEGIWPFGGQVTYVQYQNHYVAPSVTSACLYVNHSEITNQGFR
jgi:hypothetical protein